MAGLVHDRHLKPDERRCMHLDELPLVQYRLVGKALNIGIGRVADVDHADVGFDG